MGNEQSTQATFGIALGTAFYPQQRHDIETEKAQQDLKAQQELFGQGLALFLSSFGKAFGASEHSMDVMLGRKSTGELKQVELERTIARPAHFFVNFTSRNKEFYVGSTIEFRLNIPYDELLKHSTYSRHGEPVCHVVLCDTSKPVDEAYITHCEYPRQRHIEIPKKMDVSKPLTCKLLLRQYPQHGNIIPTECDEFQICSTTSFLHPTRVSTCDGLVMIKKYTDYLRNYTHMASSGTESIVNIANELLELILFEKVNTNMFVHIDSNNEQIYTQALKLCVMFINIKRIREAINFAYEQYAYYSLQIDKLKHVITMEAIVETLYYNIYASHDDICDYYKKNLSVAVAKLRRMNSSISPYQF